MNPTDVTYDALIATCANRRDYADEALVLFERMKAASHVPTERTYQAVLRALSHKSDAVLLIDNFFQGAMKDLDTLYEVPFVCRWCDVLQ